VEQNNKKKGHSGTQKIEAGLSREKKSSKENKYNLRKEKGKKTRKKGKKWHAQKIN
jgi:hypothetical protein